MARAPEIDDEWTMGGKVPLMLACDLAWIEGPSENGEGPTFLAVRLMKATNVRAAFVRGDQRDGKRQSER